MGKTGQCLCGAVEFHAPNASDEVHICHCNMCRRQGGGPAFGIDGGPGVTIEGEDNLTVYRSSDWAERAFCKHCGSMVYYRLAAGGTLSLVPGQFHDETGLKIVEQIFVDEKPGYYDFANQTPMKTGAEVIAEFEAAQSEPGTP